MTMCDALELAIRAQYKRQQATSPVHVGVGVQLETDEVFIDIVVRTVITKEDVQVLTNADTSVREFLSARINTSLDDARLG